MSDRSTISPYLDDTIKLRRTEGINQNKRPGSSLRVSGSSNLENALNQLIKKPASTGDKALASSFTAQQRSAEQTTRNIQSGTDIISISLEALESLKTLTEKQLQLIDGVTSRTSRADLRQQISDEVAELATRFNETVYNSQYNSEDLFDNLHSVNISGSTAHEFEIGDLLERFRIENSGVRGTTSYIAGNPGAAEVTRFNYVAGTGINESYEITFQDANYGSGGPVGDGTFAAPLSLNNSSVATTVGEVEVGDINGDGFDDIVVSKYNSDTEINIFLGNGDGTFDAALKPIEFTAFQPGEVELYDFNEDGFLDIMFGAAGAQPGIALALGNGDGTFKAAATVVTANSTIVTSLEVADFDGDNDLDIVFGTSGGAVEVALGNGNGSFNATLTFTPHFSTSSEIAIADLNEDGELDLLVSGITPSDGVQVFLGVGDGTFTAGQTMGAAARGSMAIGDLDGDGNLDFIATAGNYAGDVQVFLGNGDGTFEARTTYDLGEGASKPILADVNGDSNLDIITGNAIDNTFDVLLGNGNGTFLARTSTTAPVERRGISVGDFNEDGITDIATAEGSSLNVFLGNSSAGTPPDGTFLASISYSSSLTPSGGNAGPDGTFSTAVSYATGTNTGEVTYGDLNDDGITDLVFAMNLGVDIRLGNGDGTFSSAGSFSFGGDVTSDLKLGDFDQDGNLDIAASEGEYVSILLGNGNGSFDASISYHAGAGRTIQDLEIADIDEDGTLDIITSDALGVSVLQGDGTGSFTAIFTIDHNTYYGNIDVGDIDKDGNLDYIVTSTTNEYVGVAYGNGDGTFDAMVGSWEVKGSADTVNDVKLEDVNNDGRLDIVAGLDSGIAVRLGNGDGSFKVYTQTVLPSPALQVEFGDANKDGYLDLFALDNTGDTLHVALANGDGTFKASISYSHDGTAGDGSMAVTDITQDGIVDVVFGEGTKNKYATLIANGQGPSGLFEEGREYAFSSNLEVVSLATGDINGDGMEDLVSTTDFSTILLQLGNGDGSFKAATTLQYLFFNSQDELSLTDLNNDGELDIVFSTNTSVGVSLGNGDGTFLAAVSYSAGSRANDMITADVNDDGVIDVITSNQVGSNFSIMLGNGDGTLKVATTFSTTTGAFDDFRIGDFNKDGNLDIAGSGSSLEIIFGNGDGSFNAGTSYGGITSISDLVVGDFNLDGNLDIATTRGLAGNIFLHVFMGNSNGSFAAQITYAADGTFTSTSTISIASHDVNEDGLLDIILGSDRKEGFTILEGNSDGTFKAGLTSYNINGQLQSLTLSDLDNDGALDVIGTTYYGESFLTVFKSVLENEQPIQTISEVALKDINSDGFNDLVTTAGKDEIHIHLGNGDGTFSFTTSFLYNGDGIDVIRFGDFNKDGEMDLALSGVQSVEIRLGNGDGTFKAGNVASGFINPLHDLEVADFNKDGNLDVLGITEQGLSVYYSGDGTGAVNFVRYHTHYPYSERLAVGDLNNDGNLDYVFMQDENSSNSFAISYGNGDGTFKAYVTTEFDSTANRDLQDIQLADINNDGKLDVIGTIEATTGHRIEARLGNGDGTFLASTTTIVPGLVESLTFADINGDGDLDLIGTSDNSNAIIVALGNGNGTFNASVSYYYNVDGANSLAVDDINEDGIADIITAGGFNGTYNVMIGNGDGATGTFSTTLTLTTGQTPRSAVTGDFNGDGFEDMAFAEYSDYISVFLGNGDGTFKARVSYYAINDPIDIKAVDLDNDGALDLVTGSAQQNVVKVLMGVGDGTFGTVVSYTSGTNSEDITVVDINDDGAADIITANRTDSTISVLLNNGDGTFTAQTTFTAQAGQVNDIAYGDFNNDGNMDIAAAVNVPGFSKVELFLGNGDGSFAAGSTFGPSGASMLDLISADFNGDGLLDLVAGGGSDDVVYVLAGNNDGSFSAAISYYAGDHASAIASADVNGDGTADLLISNNHTETMTLLVGNTDGSFTAGVTFGSIYSRSVAFADFNEDGAIDIVAADMGVGGIGNSTQIFFGDIEGGTGGSSPPSLQTNDTLTIYVPGGNYGADPELTLDFVFSIDGEATVGGATVINILSTDTAAQIATKVAAAITAHADADYVTATANSPSSGQLTLSYGTGINSGQNVTDTVLNIGTGFTITKTQDGSPVTAGGYTRFYDGTTNYDIWYRVDGVGAAPGGGGTKIMVDVSSTDTLDEVLDATITAINTSTSGNFTATHDGTQVTVTRTAIGAVAGPPTTHSAVGAGAIGVTVVTPGADPSASSGGVDSTTDLIEILSHSFNTGDAVTIYGEGDIPGGLEEGVLYYVIKIDNDNVKLARTAADAAAGIGIDITSNGSGSLTLIGKSTGSATYGTGALYYDLSTDALANEAKIEANLQLQRINGEIDRVNALGGGFKAYTSISQVSAIALKRSSTQLSADQVERDASKLTRDIRLNVENAMGVHSDLNPLSVLKLLKEDDED